MKCINHPDRDAVGICVSCGAGLCADCRYMRDGAAYCKDCYETHQPMRVHPEREGEGLNVWSVGAWVLAVVGWWPGLEFVSVAGLLLGFVALGDIRVRAYSQKGRAYALAAIWCAALGLVFKMAVVIYYLAQGLSLSPWLNPFKYVGALYGVR